MSHAPPPHAPDHNPPEAPASRRPPAVSRAERRLRSMLRSDEDLVASTRGWVSRAGPLRMLVAARTLDYLVVTDHRLYVFTMGFFTRQPRRCVLDTTLDRLGTSERKARRGRHLLISSIDHRTLLVDLRSTFRSSRFADQLLARTRRPTS